MFASQIQVKGNSSKVLAEMTLNIGTTNILLNNLTSKGAYSVRVSAFTAVGVGPWSEHITLFPGHARGLKAPRSSETWLVLLVVVMALLLGLACSTVLYLRRTNSNKQLGHLSGTYSLLLYHFGVLYHLTCHVYNIEHTCSVEPVIKTYYCKGLCTCSFNKNYINNALHSERSKYLSCNLLNFIFSTEGFFYGALPA